MEFVNPIITPIVESLMISVKKHLSFFFSSTQHVTNMRNKLSELNETKHDIEDKKKEALRNDRLIPERVRGWLKQVESINEEASKISTGGNECLNLKMRYKAGKRSSNIFKKINDLLEKQGKIEWSDRQIPLGMVDNHAGTSTSETVHDYDVAQNIFPSRQSIFIDILKLLEPDSKIQVAAVWGMGGVGKTTMMEDIMKAVKKRGMFQWVVKVDIGSNYDPIATQDVIAKRTGAALIDETKQERADRLGKRFEGMSESGEKILVIMDDVWEAINLKDIGLTSPFPKGFKLLVTSRNEKVFNNMDIETSSIFRIGCLEASDANSFFWDTVRISDMGGELRTIGEDILKKCGGLPIAIKTIAVALRGEEKDAWEVATKSLQRHNFEDIEGFEGVVYRIFEISYKYLKKDDDKEIFVLCGLFPDDVDIALEELLRYGWGLRLFKKADSLVEARKRTKTSVSNLIRANLLTESSTVGCVKMHDLARAFVLSNISKSKQASIVNHGDKSEWPTEDTRESCERILLVCKGMSEFPEDFYYPNLALLKLMNGDKEFKFPEDFHKRMEKLEVIAYDYMQNPLLPVSLQCSFNLRTLCLHSCSLVDNDISFVGDLVNLEVLSIAHCRIRKLPSTVAKLKNLKLLDLTGCINLCIDVGILQNLDKLEELYMRCSSNKPIRFMNANCDELETLSKKLYALEVEFFKNILEPKSMSFTKLQRFRISMGCLLKEKPEHTNDIYSSTLKLVTNRSDLLECKINELFSKTEELHLSVKDMTYVEDIIMPLSQHYTFSMLKALCVSKCADLTHLFTIPVANSLKQLRSLTVSSCPVLKSLVSLCDGLNVMELPQLVELELYDLPNFTSIFPENNISTTQPLFNKEVVFPKLSKIKVFNVKKLKHMWGCEITSGEEDNVSKLREIKVVGCDCLVNLFPRNPMRLLNHLEELKVERCRLIEVLFNIDMGKIEQFGSNTNLRRILCENLVELREVWRINEDNKSGHLIGGFQAIETIDIRRCQNFRNVFIPTTANFDIGALKDIKIILNRGEELEDMQITSISKMPEISEDDGSMSIVSFPSYYLTSTFHHLRKIDFQGFKGAEVMFEMECPSINRELVPTQQQKPLLSLPCLEELKLVCMDKLSHVWKCNKWNEFFILYKNQPQSLFQNLTSIYLHECKSIKYLCSPFMSKLLSSLKEIKISRCEGMEEVVSNRDDDDDDDEVLTTSTTTLFSYLDLLELSHLDNLKHIGGVAKGKTNVTSDQFKSSQVGLVPWSLCQYSTKIRIGQCDALSSVIPSYAATQMHKLQELYISSCKSMMEVFETKEINNDGCSSSVYQGSVQLPRPNNIIMHHELTNLKILTIFGCDLLEYVFTFSTVESLQKLEKLCIDNCKEMKVIVREENGEKSSQVEFPRLKSIELQKLPNFVGFFLRMNINFQFPSLDYVMIKHCPQMMVFTYGESTAPKLEYIHTCLGKHNLKCGLNFHRSLQTPYPNSDSSSLCPATVEGTLLSFHNLIEMRFNKELKKIVPSSELQQLQNLQNVHGQFCYNLEEVFEVESEVTNNKSRTVVTFPKLKEVEFTRLDSLKYIWKSNQWVTLEFPKLTKLDIYGCKRLEYVFTTSMVDSLMQLQELHIEWCDRLEVIVKKEEGCDGKASEIMLPCLKSLKLVDLTSLKGFCLGKENFTLPSLNTLVIKDCSEIRIFSEGRAVAPELKLVETSCGYFRVGEDMNSFMLTKKQEENIFQEPESNSIPTRMNTIKYIKGLLRVKRDKNQLATF